jgi:hypothetical protein
MFVAKTVMKSLQTCFITRLRLRCHFDVLRERKYRPTARTSHRWAQTRANYTCVGYHGTYNDFAINTMLLLIIFTAKISHKLIEVGILKNFEYILLGVTIYPTENNK